MKRNERALNIDLQPKLPKKKRMSEMFAEVKIAANDYDMVLWVVDLDKILEEEQSKRKGGRGPKDEFTNYYKELSKRDNVKLLVANRCLEYWFLLHFEYSSRSFNNCGEANQLLKRHLKDYEKTEKYYMKNDLYKKLNDKQADAIKNGKRLGEFNLNNFENSL